MNWHLTWQSPPFLLLLLPLVVFGIVVWRSAAHTRREAALFGLRCFSLLLLVLALAQPVLSSGSAKPIVFVVDSSASMEGLSRPQEVSWFHSALQAAPSGSARWLVTFGPTPALSPLPHRVGSVALGPPLRVQGTNIEAALRLAIGASPSGSRVVLLSDGVQTEGTAAAVAPEARQRHTPIDVVPLGGQQYVDAAVTRLQVARAVRPGDPLPLLVTVRSTVSGRAQLLLHRDGQVAGHERLILQRGDNPFVLGLQAPRLQGWHAYRVSISMKGDGVPENNALDATTRVGAPARVLLAGLRTPDPFAGVLRLSGVDVRIVSPKNFPASSGSIAAFDGVVLDDIPATALNQKQVSALDAEVRSGGVGLLVLGGRQSLTLGHYSLSPLEHMLPVFSVPPSTLRQGNIGLQLIMDRSGSMNNLAGNLSKISMSQAAANIAVDFAHQHKDDLGVVSFDVTPHILVPLQKMSDPAVARHAHQIVNAMTADGGTNIYSALQTGLGQILRSNAPYRHMILMTDGVSDPANYDALLRRIASSHITLSTVGLGQDADVKLLQALARIGRGRFYYTANAADLPHIFAKEVRLSAGPTRVAGAIPVSVGASSTILRDLPFGALPAVHGYPATTLKPGAQAPLIAHTATRASDPVLAQWQYGLGRVLVWTPGVSAAWAGNWMSPQTGLWNSAIHWMLRGVAPEPLMPKLEANSARIDTMENTGTLLTVPGLGGAARTPKGQLINLSFQQVGPGQYSAPLGALQPGVYQLTVRSSSDRLGPESAAVAQPYSPEFNLRSSDRPMLTQLAELTGGRVLSDPHQLAGGSSSSSVDELWWPLAALALLLFLFDVGLRLLGVGAGRDT